MSTPDPLLDTIRSVFGHDSLRPLQEESMRASLAGRDVLLVLPTGGGKSLTYQAPAMVRPGTTLVISPLIALMADQVQGLRANGVAAGMLAGGQSGEQRTATLRAFHRGELDMLYLAPERLFTEGFVERLADNPPSALVVDEAHCISDWGHDFRPEYRRIRELREVFPDLPIHACTATATERVRGDIVANLGLEDPALFIGSFDRPNLTYRFVPRHARRDQVLEVVQRHPDEAGIVYAIRRTDVDELASWLQERGVSALPYHAGLPDDVRSANQEAFLQERADVVVATVAFGMGIDRPDVRFVLHAAVPKSVEHYLQESGRAGRDGLPSECVLLHSGADVQGWRGLIEQGDEHEDTGPAIDRLMAMSRLATGARCRHRALAEHFGERLPNEACGACDVCLGEIPVLADATTVAKKILSCVYRVGQRFGAGHVTDILRGKASPNVIARGHEELSTFGLLEDLDQRTIRGAIDQLVDQDLLFREGGRYPTLALGGVAGEVLRDQLEVTLLAPPLPPAKAGAGEGRVRSKASTAGRDALSPADREVFEALRTLRQELARERSVKPYMIFGDRTLIALAERRPDDEDSLLAVHGIGEKKAADLGDRVLGLLREHAAD